MSAAQRGFCLIETFEVLAALTKPWSTFRRLEDGSWGIRGPIRILEPGKKVPVSRYASGRLTVVTCGEVIWSGKKMALARLEDEPPRRLLS